MTSAKTHHGRFAATILSSTFLIWNYGYAASNNYIAKKNGPVAAHTRSQPAKARAHRPSGPVNITGQEEVDVAVSRAGGGGMMRRETTPHSVQTVTKRFIAMQSSANTVLDMVKNLPSVRVSTNNSSGILGSGLIL